MRNLVFAMWVALWPLCCSISRYVTVLSRAGEQYSEGVRGVAALIEMAIWVAIAALLYER